MWGKKPRLTKQYSILGKLHLKTLITFRLVYIVICLHELRTKDVIALPNIDKLLFYIGGRQVFIFFSHIAMANSNTRHTTTGLFPATYFQIAPTLYIATVRLGCN